MVDQSSLQRIIETYLASERDDMPSLIPVAADANVGREGVRQRGILIALGSPIVLPALRATASKLRSVGDFVAHAPALMDPDGLQLLVTRQATLYFINATDLLLELGTPARDRLIAALADPDRKIRALSAVFLGLNGIADDRFIDPLLSLIESEQDALVSAAAATTLAPCRGADAETRALVIDLLEAFLARVNPELGESVSHATTTMRAEGKDTTSGRNVELDIASGLASMALNFIPQMLAFEP